jgi:aspartate 1-decarboxylase
MKRTFLYAKLHGARVTQADLHYEGSFSIDEELLIKSGIRENEQIHVLNISNGKRFVTYAIKAPHGSRKMCANGACAHLVNLQDSVIICAYAELDAAEIDTFKPMVLLLNEKNDYIVKENATDVTFSKIAI